MYKRENTKMTTSRLLRILYFIVLHIFGVIGFILVAVYCAVTFGFTNARSFVDLQRNQLQRQYNFNHNQSPEHQSQELSTSSPTWAETAEWSTFVNAIKKDKTAIEEASKKSGVPPRLIMSVVAAEQLRLFYTDREIYKQIFGPLSMLGVMSQYAWGIAGIKPDTAKQAEENLKNSSSPFYLGRSYENILDYPASSATSTDSIDQQRFYRLTDEHNRSYSYLYAGIILCQIIHQWHTAGFDISNKPGIMGTLYNIGFDKSKPHDNPSIGGAALTIASSTYSFGGFVDELWTSNELVDTFPQTTYTKCLQ